MTEHALSREVVRERLSDLLAGRETREQIADWAAQWVHARVPIVDDPVIWNALKELAGADLRTSPSDYLHSESDFHAWLDELELAGDDGPST